MRASKRENPMSKNNPKLHQIVAIQKGVKARVYGAITKLHQASKKVEPFIGHTKTWYKKNEDSDEFEDDRKEVRLIAEDLLKETAKLETEAMDVAATLEWGNCEAKADVVVDGQTVLTQVPVTFLLNLEKRLTDLRTFVGELPTLDASNVWEKDPNSKLFRSKPARTSRTKKVQRPIVKYDATEHHPAQTEMISEDVVIGSWETTHLSGAITMPRQELLLERLNALLDATKMARMEACSISVENRKVGEALFGYLFAN